MLLNMSDKYKNIKNRILYLRKKLELWSDHYYNKNQSLVTDKIYDFNLSELNKLELKYPFLRSQDSPTQVIGKNYNSKFLQIKHKSLMLSLDSISNEIELINFNKRIQKTFTTEKKITYCCELKIDGLAMNLIYENGVLTQASTRGNGMFGEDVTKNALTIQTIPYNLKLHNIASKYIEIRGEVFINKSKFCHLNEIAKLNNRKPFSNPRNAASGSLRQINPKVTESRYLMFYGYGIGFSKGYNLPNSQYKRLQTLKTWGIPINNYAKICIGVPQILSFYDKIKKIRKNLDFEIDGIVIKVDSVLHQDKIGFVTKAPKWAVAYKFPALEVVTQIIGIDFTVGRTGTITPIAQVKPVCFLGTIVRSVSLYNFHEVNRLNIMINDTIIVKRSGEVIPKVSKVIFSKRTKNAEKVVFPKTCIICNSDIVNVLGKKKWYCTGGISCNAQRKAALIHFSSRNALNMRGMGKKIISKLVDKKFLITPADFFRLNIEKITCIDGIKLKSGKKLITSIKNSKEVKLHRLIYGLGIPQVGLTTSINLENYYKTYYNFINSDMHSLLKIKDIGKSTAICIRKFLEKKNNIRFMQDLLKLNLKIK